MAKLQVVCQLPTYEKPADPRTEFDKLGLDKVTVSTDPDHQIGMIILEIKGESRAVKLSDLRRAIENCAL
jgi:hypothetical protein